jgi:hypothetical protein
MVVYRKFDRFGAKPRRKLLAYKVVALFKVEAR